LLLDYVVIVSNTPKPPPTLDDVARLAGVSKATASRALNPSRSCSRKNRAAVLEAVKTLGFQKNTVASILGSKRQDHHPKALGIALIRFWDAALGRSNMADDRLVAAALERGHLMQAVQLDSLDHIPALLARLYAQGVDALILDFRTSAPYWKRSSHWSKFVVVTLDSSAFDSPFHRVRRSHFDDFVLAWGELRKRGYKRIGVSLPRHAGGEVTDLLRYGALQACRKYLGAVPVPPLITDFESHAARFPDWFTHYRPDAVLSFGIGQWWQLQSLGCRMPDDVGFAVLHGGGRVVHEATPTPAVITGFSYDHDWTMFAALRLIESLHANRTAFSLCARNTSELGANWIEGSTLRPESD